MWTIYIGGHSVLMFKWSFRHPGGGLKQKVVFYNPDGTINESSTLEVAMIIACDSQKQKLHLFSLCLSVGHALCIQHRFQPRMFSVRIHLLPKYRMLIVWSFSLWSADAHFPYSLFWLCFSYVLESKNKFQVDPEKMAHAISQVNIWYHVCIL